LKLILFLVIALLVSEVRADVRANDPRIRNTPLGEIDFAKKPGKIFLDGKEVSSPKGENGVPLKLRPENIAVELNEGSDRFFLLGYLFDLNNQLVRKYIVLDLSGNNPVFSNAVLMSDSPDFRWGDNNYIYHRDGSLYFGVYSPARKQFVYKNGVISENTGPWAGPDKPEKYIEPEPEDRGPCYGVPGGLEECMEDINRNSPENVLKE